MDNFPKQISNIRAQSAPSATTLTDLYTVPASKSFRFNKVIIANRSATGTAFRISVAPGGASDATSQYQFYDIAISGNETFFAEFNVDLQAGDIVRVYATLATLSFTLYGGEI